MLSALRTFAASLLVPGLGFWIVGKPKLGTLAALGVTGLILVFGWSRLVLEPAGFVALLASYMGVQLWAATHSAVIEFQDRKRVSISRKWRPAIAFGVAFGLALCLLSFTRSTTLGYETFRTPSSSMAPTLLRGDYFVTDAWRYRSSEIEFGEIVVFEVPDSGGVIYVKRVVGLPDDTLSMASNTLYRNGAPVDEPYAVYGDGANGRMGSFAETKIPDGEYFVMGDNRNNSRDSRFIGTIPMANIGGRVAHVWYSYEHGEGVRWERFPAHFLPYTGASNAE
jgi:signal peptidase I